MGHVHGWVESAVQLPFFSPLTPCFGQGSSMVFVNEISLGLVEGLCWQFGIARLGSEKVRKKWWCAIATLLIDGSLRLWLQKRRLIDFWIVLPRISETFSSASWNTWRSRDSFPCIASDVAGPLGIFCWTVAWRLPSFVEDGYPPLQPAFTCRTRPLHWLICRFLLHKLPTCVAWHNG